MVVALEVALVAVVVAPEVAVKVQTVVVVWEVAWGLVVVGQTWQRLGMDPLAVLLVMRQELGAVVVGLQVELVRQQPVWPQQPLPVQRSVQSALQWRAVLLQEQVG